MPVAKVGAEQNVSTGYARRRRRDTAMDGGSIPPISTSPLSRTEEPGSAIRGCWAFLLCESEPVKLYSDFGPRRTRQILADLTALAFIVAWVCFGVIVASLISELAAFGEQMEEAGAGFRQTMTDVGGTLGDVPLIGAGIRAPFDG